MTSEAKFAGTCLCGAVTFEIEGEPFHFVICHCRNCKQSSGGPFQANGFFKPNRVKITQGKDIIKEYVDGNTKSGNSISRSFCSACGSSLFMKPAASAITIVHVSNVKGSENWTPKKEFFGSDKWKWIKDIEFQQKRTSKL